ncbi:hypothetical protein MLAC_22540 [Mycobacterium lacus]|uniref:Uncharacterized protein n=1 Tax=Mycobacterium lacus TaxID=169765 RepID=A0A7I7NKD1_9MYCO|nr:hypothetical protein MLAC_22540 [Mycobacterium lacus]
MLDVADEADTDRDTDDRYAGASRVSGVAVPSVTVVHPTTPISTAAVQPSARAPRLTGTARHPISTLADVTGSGL